MGTWRTYKKGGQPYMIVELPSFNYKQTFHPEIEARARRFISYVPMLGDSPGSPEDGSDSAGASESESEMAFLIVGGSATAL